VLQGDYNDLNNLASREQKEEAKHDNMCR